MKKWEAIQHFNTPISPIKPKDHNKIGGLRNLRKNTGALLEYLWELSGSIRFYKVDAAIVVGEEKHTGQPITTLYIGHYDNYEYILNEIYAAYKVVKK
nr:hypothetical protein [Deltaproteobacteria bacterium]